MILRVKPINASTGLYGSVEGIHKNIIPTGRIHKRSI